MCKYTLDQCVDDDSICPVYCVNSFDESFSSQKRNGDAVDSCWGYEVDCDAVNSYARPACPGDHNGWVKSKKEQLSTFYKQGDFGFVRDQRNEMMVMCEPSFKVKMYSESML